MFRTIARLLFGDQEESEDGKSEEVKEEDWLVITHQEAAEIQDALTPDIQESTSTLLQDPPPNTEPDRVSDAAAGDCRAVSALLLQPKALVELTQLTCLQKAKADRPRVSRNTIQRQNRIRQRVRPASFHLQQPVLRGFSR
ncbi:hypothetical protein OJAV_G00041950 [Oryzias javanicus]|uniref:Tumor protein p53-inducible nuclear protein 2 n=1 Tax=Oryzias javanicus TaxID=123683 RepID=A0A437DDJ8_ORYJA|nr:hypothetical protein OJAV_G00041950 [Oryzias javanicus]